MIQLEKILRNNIANECGLVPLIEFLIPIAIFGIISAIMFPPALRSSDSIKANKIIIREIQQVQAQPEILTSEIIKINFENELDFEGMVIHLIPQADTEPLLWDCTTVQKNDKWNHILPQNCDNDEYWSIDSYSKNLREKYRMYRIFAAVFLIVGLFYLYFYKGMWFFWFIILIPFLFGLFLLYRHL